MHQNKLFGLIVIVVGVLGSLAIVSQMDIAAGECIIVKLPGDASVERCKEQSTITTQQSEELEVVTEQSTIEIEKIKQEIDFIPKNEQDEKKVFELKQYFEEVLQRNDEISKSIPYLQKNDARLLLEEQSALLEQSLQLQSQFNLTDIEGWEDVFLELNFTRNSP